MVACASPLPLDASTVTPAPPLLGGYLRETRIVYPLVIGDGWRAQDEKRYEPPEMGVSVRYAADSREGAWLDVYFYPAGEVGAAFLDAHMAQTIDNLHGADGAVHGRTLRFGAISSDRVVLDAVDDASADGELRSAAGSMRAGEAAYHSALAIALRQYYFIKVRYTVPETTASPESVRTDAARLLGQLIERVDITSTGACGAPLSRVVIGVDEAFPDVRLADVTRDEQMRAVLTPDFRVVTRDAGDPAVLLLDTTGRALRQTRYPGCAGETPVEPQVPDGHREIRIEYRMPAARRAASAGH
ncbi:hypothetical protein [Luteimonas deserti]|uniref:Uncharacterized protein n=1 Tax=Luteimonas deserti TaxID=2752306 RepID=A0A7Z0QRI9_9GAMM|nr:hypothetical protein [Luteimonas deserti]NYZ62522.1 hypothetical protein [Luteimonas deserti]